ncbi:inner-membrane translocator [Halobellus sp. GM3]|uniref:inner-membrane translocator n=1 Tax=Halobellus sp. GM3 TaxID=3458410 RepID=UPI00403DB2DB
MAKVGHDLVERVDGHDHVAELVSPDELNAEIFEQLGQQALHAGGPVSTAGQRAFADLSERFVEEVVLPRIDEDIIDEHEDNPIGQHSDDLQRVLHYFRRQPNDGKYVIIETERSQTWAIGRLAGERGEPPEIVEGGFESVEETAHEIFVRRVDEVREEYQ